MSAEVAKEGTESEKLSEEIKDEQSVPELENVEEEIKSKENLNEDVKVGDKRDSSSENPDCMKSKKNIKFIFFSFSAQTSKTRRGKLSRRVRDSRLRVINFSQIESYRKLVVSSFHTTREKSS